MPEDDEERVSLGEGTFEENLATVLGADPDEMDDSIEEPEQGT